MRTYCEWCHRTVGCLADHEKTRDHLRAQMIKLDKIKIREPSRCEVYLTEESNLMTRLEKFRLSLEPKKCAICSKKDVMNLSQHNRIKGHRDR